MYNPSLLRRWLAFKPFPSNHFSSARPEEKATLTLNKSAKERLNLRLIVVIPAIWVLISLSVGLMAMTLTQFILGIPTPSSKEVLFLRLTIVGLSLIAGIFGALLAYGITQPIRKVISEAQRMLQYAEPDLPPLKADNEVGALSTVFDQAFVSFIELVQAREMLDNLHEGIVALDEKGTLAGMNLKAQEILEIPLAEGREKNFQDFLSESAHNRILHDFVQSALRDRTERTHNRLFFRSRSGKEQLLSVKATPLRLKKDAQVFVGVILTLKEYPAEFQDLPEIIGKSDQLAEVLTLAGKIAPTDSTVLLTGESGTGKELIANAIHRLSRRKEGPFIKLNCAAIPEALLESELFGHERGAFTGAVAKKPGMFELADGGAIFLDEIGDMSLPIQAKLLRVLQEKEFTPVGGDERKKVDVRIIAAANSELVLEVQRGKFREDLYYRLNGITISMPSLRERKSDIPLLADHFLEELAKHTQAQKKSLSRVALEYLLSYSWPGNIRELKNAIERAWLLSNGPVIQAEDFSSFLIAPVSEGHGQDAVEEPFQNKASLNETVEAVEKELIVQALKKSGWIQIQAAKLLGINHKNLWHKIRKHKIARENLNL